MCDVIKYNKTISLEGVESHYDEQFLFYNESENAI